MDDPVELVNGHAPRPWTVGDQIWRERTEDCWAVWVYQPDGRWALCVTRIPLDTVIEERAVATPRWQVIATPRGIERWEIIKGEGVGALLDRVG
jgi:hypothetical protein